MRTLTAPGYTRTRWRNGRGETAVIASAPPAGSAGDPRWRLSLAAVTEDGPFSLFPEFTRILTVVSGAGLRLTSPQGLDQTARCGDSVRFSGALDVTCNLLDGPITDLNLMFSPAVTGACATTLRVEKPIRFARAPGQTLFVFCASGQALCTGAAAAEVDAGDTLCLEPTDPGTEYAIAPAGARPARVVLVRLED